MHSPHSTLQELSDFAEKLSNDIVADAIWQAVNGAQFQERHTSYEPTEDESVAVREGKDLGDTNSSHSRCSGIPQTGQLLQNLSHAQTLIPNTLSAEQLFQEPGFPAKTLSHGILRCSSV